MPAKRPSFRLSKAVSMKFNDAIAEIGRRRTGMSESLGAVAPDILVPSTVEEWQQFARRCGMSMDRMMDGQWTVADIWPGILGHFEARRDAAQPTPPPAGVTAAKLAGIMGVERYVVHRAWRKSAKGMPKIATAADGRMDRTSAEAWAAAYFKANPKVARPDTWLAELHREETDAEVEARMQEVEADAKNRRRR